MSKRRPKIDRRELRAVVVRVGLDNIFTYSAMHLFCTHPWETVHERIKMSRCPRTGTVYVWEL
jgi:hypothetical protein